LGYRIKEKWPDAAHYLKSTLRASSMAQQTHAIFLQMWTLTRQVLLRQASFYATIIATTRAADRISADDCPARVALEAGNNLAVEKVVKHARLDHVEPAVTVHHSDHHGAPRTFELGPIIT
jgi:hypothetical protein